MKRLFLLLCVSATLNCFSQSADANIIRKTLSDQTAAWNRGDIPAFMNGYWQSDSLMFIGKSGITYGWSKTLENYKRNYPDPTAMGQLSFTIIEVKNLSPEYYHVTGKWHLERSIGNLDGHFTLLFRKINGQWLIISDHSS